MEKQRLNPPAKQLTQEQIAIINSNGNITINAVAGSGKTTTIIEYAASRPKDARILYLAFNKSVKLEATRRFAEKGLSHVKIETAHSLAFRYIMRGSNYKVRAHGYKTHEIAALLGLNNQGERHAEYILANHINKFITYFCNSDKQKVQDLNYLDTVTDPKAKNFVRSFYKFIENGARVFLSKMDKAEIEITHDFYLKKFQLSNPVLPYDYILFDEGQDASPAMLDVFLKQKATKVIVGDAHQQIYAWRHAVNSLAKTSFTNYTLSTSFRFPQPIADLASSVLLWKTHLQEFTPVTITGKGNGTATQSKATIARSNLGLLLKAIEYITDHRNAKKIYFEGNIHSYTYADDGASLYDVLNLHNDKKHLIRDQLIKSMNDMSDLEEYIEKTEDAQLSMLAEIVQEYGDEIPGIIQTLKRLHTGDEERHKAEMIFSTVHRAKGMEYDVVYLVSDFITEKKLERAKTDAESQKQPLDTSRLNEEVNLLYVAATRAKTELHIPSTLLPKDTPAAACIHIVQPKEDAKLEYMEEFDRPYLKSKSKKYSLKDIKSKTNSLGRRREINRAGYQPWTPELDDELLWLHGIETPVGEIADKLKLTRGQIIARLKKLNDEE
ncbi:MAG TPA: UvrD-helicase domain-containing protein [Chitinophagaceae bacterium]|jgi:superfamily I DNA/RNA helicase|nr:UvrD-helicase domain-containing protein [Chitinophagaceae bacterium]